MEISSYWNTQKDMPEDIKQKLSDLAENCDKKIIPLDDRDEHIISVNGDVFKKVFSINRQYLYRGNFTADPDENNYSESDNYLTSDGLSGFSITSDGWLVSMFSNHAHRGFMNSISGFLRNNVKKLECITTDNEPYLVDMYIKHLDCSIVARSVDDTELMYNYYSEEFMDLFLNSYGRPYHIFMINDGKREKHMKTISGYFNAHRYVNELCHLDNK